MQALALLFAVISHAQAQPTIGQSVLTKNPQNLGPSCVNEVVLTKPMAIPAGLSTSGERAYKSFGSNWAPGGIFEIPGADPIATFVHATKEVDETVQSTFFTASEFAYQEMIDSAKMIYPKESESRKNCGTETIAARGIGAAIYGSIHTRMPEADEETLNQCRYMMGNDLDFTSNWLLLSGLTEAPIQDAVIKACPNVTLTLNVVQAGGSRRDFPKQFKVGPSDENKFFASVTCKLSEISVCAQAARDLNNYVYTGTFRKSIDAKKPVGSDGGYAVLFTVAKKYIYFVPGLL